MMEGQLRTLSSSFAGSALAIFAVPHSAECLGTWSVKGRSEQQRV
jgi:hypothetical protein